MSEIRTHEQVVGIVCTLAAEAHNDCEQEREEYGTQTRQAMRWLEDTDAALRAALAKAEEDRERIVAEIQKWREGRAYIGTPMTYVDQRLIDTVRTIIGDARAAKMLGKDVPRG